MSGIVPYGNLELINPDLFADPNLSNAIGFVNDNFETLRKYGLSVRSGYYSLTTVNNSTDARELVKTTKHTCINFEATTAALSSLLPASGHKPGDTYLFSDNGNNAGTYTLTINANGNAINGVVANLTITANKGFILLEFINDSVGFVISATSGFIGALSQIERTFVVTTAFAANEVINLSTGAGTSAGITTVTGNSISLPASDALFKSMGNVEVFVNGQRLSKTGTKLGVIWDSTNSLHINIALNIDDEIIIKAPSTY